MSVTSPVEYRVVDKIAYIRLNRPETANALDLDLALALCAAAQAAGGDESVHLVTLTAAGGRFCAGGDLAAMAADGDTGKYVYKLATAVDTFTKMLWEMPKPVLASVQGVAAGAGLALVLAADLVVASRDARFLAAYGAVNLTPDCGLSYLLPRSVGEHRALEMTLLDRVLTADEAGEWGIVTMVCDNAELAATTDALARRLLARSSFALGNTKRLIRQGWEQTRVDSGWAETASIARAAATPEAADAITALFQR
ncbi:enoyl-CoA hydratase/isomerase family protein [Actinomadura formosensis]|uniref:enoyl-CoA hydratase/isomerase family protein n=1 Tax=Actinomadura formosensis TaxID=60706 RepID=UPI0008316021|nr:enoyl-CoA hydratase/isomerase family protein [Actinomadura formosensis]